MIPPSDPAFEKSNHVANEELRVLMIVVVFENYSESSNPVNPSH
jgi:hypothetical protein